ncbi:flagellar export chaperone FliS [Crassaminicella thermophila]|uniref:Flagellar secretion chaperone FliS n=1 Tax=Crassaminicella thermophila TaxID=2599308 RepID=A0A5C0SEC7_CRATE|nr:flagellar export chaperone FliS [Crassaminicella thermophila]QEK11329.1 flagellar export chaperone FliS [Crassaminicella thermophila]
MAMRNPYGGLNQYKQNNIMTAPPQELTLMLYNGAVKFVNQAILFIEQKNIQKSHEAIIRANDIITELNATLDMKYEVSKGLRAIYDFISEKLVDANIKKDKGILEEVLPLITELRDTWKQAMELAKKR